MFRRTLVAVVAIVLSGAVLSACSPTPTPDVTVVSDPPTVPPAPLDPSNPASAPEGEPMDSPPVAENPLIVVSSPVDPTGFAEAPFVASWTVYDDLSYAVVTIQLSSYSDWSYFAEQVGVDETVNPLQVQMGVATARNLIDIDQVATEILQYREDIGSTPIDIRTIEVYFDLFVVGM